MYVEANDQSMFYLDVIGRTIGPRGQPAPPYISHMSGVADCPGGLREIHLAWVKFINSSRAEMSDISSSFHN